MYRLVLAALVALLAVTLVMAALGRLFFSPLDLLATAAIACAATLAASWVGGACTRTRPQIESSLITGLILAFVLWPGVDAAALTGAAVAGGAAGASKYLIAWRGRHVLNPAVVGLLVVTWTHTGFAGWWVGSRELAPAVAILGLVVVWRTRRLGAVIGFLVPAVGLGILGYLRFDAWLSDAVAWALIASPVLFLAGFMLTEPLTSPPRRWQRVAVGALVGGLTAAPLFVGASWLSAEVALGIGNAVAFGFGLRGRVRLRLLGAERRGDLLDMRFAPSRVLRFQPGQYVEVDVPQALAQPGGARDPRGRRRVLSVASAPSSPEVRLVTRVAGAVVGGPVGGGPSAVKRALAAMAPGDSITATLVAGDFLLPRSGPVALIGAGVGVTPFLSQAEAAGRGEITPPAGGWDIVVVYAVGDVADVVPPAAEALAAGIRWVLVVPAEQVGAAEATYPGLRVVAGEALSPEVLAAAVPDLAQRRALVSGSPGAVAAVRRAVRAAGGDRVKTDVFLGY